MANLIPLGKGRIGDAEANTVNARDLHVFLEVGRDFSNWIKGRVDEYGFLEGQDYVLVEVLRSPNLASAKARSQRVKDYHLSLDMAKELAMVEKTAKGREARRYFIECERLAKAAAFQPRPEKPQTGPLVHFLNCPPGTEDPLVLEKRLDEAEAILDRERADCAEGLRDLTQAMRCMTDAVRDLAGRRQHVPGQREARVAISSKNSHREAAPLPIRIPLAPVVRTRAQHILLDYFRRHGSHIATYNVISGETGMPYNTIRNIVHKFAQEGVIRTKQWGRGSNRGLEFIVDC